MNVRTQFQKRRFLGAKPSPHGLLREGLDGICGSVPCSTGGVALVVTLIFLAIITTLAIAFLAITRRETSAVDVMNKTTDAELAADSALERAKAEILAPFTYRNSTNYGGTNGTEILGPDFMVSVVGHTNRIPSYGAWHNPSPPVFVDTNRNGGAGPFEDRHHLDLNRNRMFEPTGYVPDTDNSFAFTGQTNWRVGDPQWIGILQDPRRAHDTNNRYIGRYAYMVVPAGRALDVNWIHNDGVNRLGNPGFYREQGVGGWEINLAAFLANLNTNTWGTNATIPYAYLANSVPGSQGGSGDAFEDARDILAYRYGRRGTGLDMDRADQVFPGGVTGPDQAGLDDDETDVFANGFSGASNPDDNDRRTEPWVGAPSRTNILNPHEFLTRFPKAVGFTNRLVSASSRGNSYDRYTFYRMLGQLGTESVEDEGKLNINYVNVRSWANGEQIRSSDLIPWSLNTTNIRVPRLGGTVDMGRRVSEIFFITAITNLIAREPSLAFMVTNRLNGTLFSIPVFTNRSTYTTNTPNNEPLYSARLHQLLQITANIFEATTGAKAGERQYPYFPTLFRPWFTESNGNVFITDYTVMDESARDFRANYAWRDLDTAEKLSSAQGSTDLVYGVPLIVGARSGLPSFNELGVVSVAQATRRLVMVRDTPGSATKRWDRLTNRFELSIRTMMQVEARNSDTNRYPRPLQMIVNSRPAIEVKERTNGPALVQADWRVGSTNLIPQLSWSNEVVGIETSMDTSLQRSPVFATNVFSYLIETNAELFAPTNQWTLSLTNRLLFYLVDTDPAVPGGRIIDMVTLSRPHNVFRVGEILDSNWDEVPSLRKIWLPNLQGAVTEGIREQIAISQDPYSTPEGVWGNWEDSLNKVRSANNFRTFYNNYTNIGVKQVPFTPSRVMVQANYYTVDDPIVHYTFDGLRYDQDPQKQKLGSVPYNSGYTNIGLKMEGRNPLSMGWNKGDSGKEESAGQGTLDPTKFDPGVVHPSRWSFPTNLFPSVGWIGRVHRGTPWQTIYLKSRPLYDRTTWIEHSGNQRGNYPVTAESLQPIRDRELFDVFTTDPHPNATRGRLSINQTNLAAWSALLSGVMASGVEDDPLNAGFVRPANRLLNPAAADQAIMRIAQAVNVNRARLNANGLSRFGQYHRLGEILSTPELSDLSPFLTENPPLFYPSPEGIEEGLRGPRANAHLNDEDYERLPQQLLSLLKIGEPRFVVYTWGQSLKPARRDPDNSGPSILPADDAKFGPKGLCSNYQITGETAARAVIRVEFDRDASGQIRYDRPHAIVESFNVLPVE